MEVIKVPGAQKTNSYPMLSVWHREDEGERPNSSGNRQLSISKISTSHYV